MLFVARKWSPRCRRLLDACLHCLAVLAASLLAGTLCLIDIPDDLVNELLCRLQRSSLYSPVLSAKPSLFETVTVHRPCNSTGWLNSFTARGDKPLVRDTGIFALLYTGTITTTWRQRWWMSCWIRTIKTSTGVLSRTIEAYEMPWTASYQSSAYGPT